jgi:hypothetical protein
MIPTGFRYLQLTYLHIPTKRFADGTSNISQQVTCRPKSEIIF